MKIYVSSGNTKTAGVIGNQNDLVDEIEEVIK